MPISGLSAWGASVYADRAIVTLGKQIMLKGVLASCVAVIAMSGIARGDQPADLPPPKPVTQEIAKPPIFSEPPLVGRPFGDTDFDSTPFREWSVGVDYLLGFFPKSQGRSIIAAEPVNGVIEGRALVAGGDQSLDRKVWSGGRLTLGYWVSDPNPFDELMPIPAYGIETRFFALGQRSLTVVNATAPTIFRPFFDVNNRGDSALVIANPGLNTGGVTANATMSMWGAEANVWKRIYDNGSPTGIGAWFIVGYRYLELDPEIRIDQVSVFQNNLAGFPAFATFAGNRITGTESISALNQFNGGQLGINLKAFGSIFILDTTFKVGLGVNHQTLDIQGSQVRTLANGSQVVSEGVVFALPSNIGRFSRDKFTQVPELDVGLVAPILPWLTLRSDFSALYMSRVIRAGSQINRVVDISQIPNFPQAASATPTGLNLPTAPFNQSDLWMLGVSVGVEMKW